MWTANSFAHRPVHRGVSSGDVSQQLGFRTPSLKALETSLRSGVWLAVAGRDSVITAHGASRKGVEKVAVPNRVEMEGAAVVKYTAALRPMSKWQFG